MFDWNPVWLSLQVAIISLCYVGVAGTGLAFYCVRREFPGKDALETVLTLPLVLPPVVTGFGLLLLIGRNGPVGKFLYDFFGFRIVFTPFAAILAGVLVSFPLMYQSAKGAFQSTDRRLEEAARTLGAGGWRVFFTVTLPLAWPGILSGLVLSFARALGEFGATAMVAGNIPGRTQTIPVAIFFATESNDLGRAGIYVLLLSLVTFSLVFWVNRWSRRRMIRYQGEVKRDVGCYVRKTAPRLFPEA